MLIYFFFRTIVQTSERKFTCVCNECSRLSAKSTAPPILSKDSASREENKINANLFFHPNYRANE